MVRRFVDETDSRRLLTPGPVTIVTTAWRDLVNAAPVAWTTPLSMDPPLVGVAVHPERHTADMIRSSGEFVLNIPGPTMLKQVAFLGSQSGRDTNKIEAAQLELFPALRVTSPLIEGCLAWIECEVNDMHTFPDHILFVSEVVRAQALDEAYVGEWLLEEERYSPMVYLGGDGYAVIGSKRRGEFQTDAQGGLILETPEEREAREEREAQEVELRRIEGDEGLGEMRRFLKE